MKATISLISAFICTTIIGQAPSIIFTTELPVNSPISFILQCNVASAIVQIDFGNGILANQSINNETTINGTIVGTQTVKIYGDGIIHFQNNNNNITNLDVSNCSTLQALHCENNKLSGLDVTNNAQLKYLYCNKNILKELDVSNNIQLSDLNCCYNELTSLSVVNNINLTRLFCYNNQLTDFDVSKNINLNMLWCSDNFLSQIDVSKNVGLTSFDCNNNQLSSIDLSNNSLLTMLSCQENNISSLDISIHTLLKSLYCGKNKLESIDLTNNPRLELLSVESNRLTSLDISNNRELNYLYCWENQLEALDVSNNSKISDLRCQNNRIEALDVSNCLNLREFYCNNNQLTSLKIPLGGNQIICSYNRLAFTTLPINGFTWGKYDYFDQDTIFRPHKSYNNNVTIDYSSEAVVNGISTAFIFMQGKKYLTTNESGLYTTEGSGEYLCYLTNPVFPRLTLTSAITTIKLYYINIDPDTIYVPAQTKSINSFTVESNTNWNLNKNSSWLSLSRISGNANGSFNFSVENNTSIHSRTAIINVSGNFAIPQTAYVIQYGIPVTITDIDFEQPATCGATGTIIIFLEEGVDGEIYSIDYNSDGVEDNQCVVLSNTITLTNIPVGTQISALRITNTINSTTSTSNITGTINSPDSPSSEISGPQNLCPFAQNVQYSTLNNENYEYNWSVTGGVNTLGSASSEIIVNWGNVTEGIISLEVIDKINKCRSSSNMPVYLFDSTAPYFTRCTGEYTIKAILLNDQITHIPQASDTLLIPLADDACRSIPLLYLLDIDGTRVDNKTQLYSMKIAGINDKVVHWTVSDRYGNINECSTTVHIELTINFTIGDVFIVSPVVCDSSGIITIYFSSILEGEELNIDYNNDGIADNRGIVKDRTIILTNIPIGTQITDLKVSMPDGSYAATSPIKGIITEPLPPSSEIKGAQNLCPGTEEINYTTNKNNDNTYNWAIKGGNIASGIGSTEIRVNWENIQQEGLITLQVINKKTQCESETTLPVYLFDSVAPQIIRCIEDYTVIGEPYEGMLSYIITLDDSEMIPLAEDNCQDKNLNYTFSAAQDISNDRSKFIGYRLIGIYGATIDWIVTDIAGNTDRCSTNVHFETKKVIPTAFSPNNDRVNDVWNISFLVQFPECKVKVFNRWGVLVFESDKGYPTSWDGTQNGSLVPVDTYYYIVNLGDSSEPMKRQVTILY